jgi:hypothetical protein
MALSIAMNNNDDDNDINNSIFRENWDKRVFRGKENRVKGREKEKEEEDIVIII